MERRDEKKNRKQTTHIYTYTGANLAEIVARHAVLKQRIRNLTTTPPHETAESFRCKKFAVALLHYLKVDAVTEPLKTGRQTQIRQRQTTRLERTR